MNAKIFSYWLMMVLAVISLDAHAFRTATEQAPPVNEKKPATKTVVAPQVAQPADKVLAKRPKTANKKAGTTKLPASKSKQVDLEKRRLDAEYKKRMEQSAIAAEESKKRELEKKKRIAENTPPQPALENEQYSAKIANGWEKFKSSIKQGGTVGCSDAEKALNHCIQ